MLAPGWRLGMTGYVAALALASVLALAVLAWGCLWPWPGVDR